ncbi:MAG: hypothetical protein R3305_08985, partial [Gammaproteobacteria bacterium]|nr:hypothetical protein [Gammaproteobacteria bacterium]
MNSVRVTLWQIETGQRLAEWTTDFGFIGPPAVSFDGGFAGIAEATVTGTALRTFRVDDGVSAGTVIGGPWIDWQLAADAAFIATLDGSRRGMVFDLPTGRRIAEFLHDHELVQLISAPTADRVIAVDINGDIFAWPLLDSRETLTARDSSYLGTTTAGYGFDAAAGRLAVWSGDANVRVHSLSDGFTEALLTHGSGDDRDLQLSADGERLVSASGRLFRAWRLEAAPRRGFDFGSVSAVALDSGGASGVIGYRSGHVRMLAAVPDAIESGRHGGGDRIGHRGSVTSLTFAAEHELAASGGSDGVVRIWNTTTGAPSRYVLRHPSGPIGMLAFSPDGGWLVSTGPSSARVWVLETGALASAVEVDGTPLAVAFAPNSRSFAVGDSAGNIFLSSPRAAGGVLALRGRSPIASLDYAPDSTLLASGSEDGHLVVWDSLAAAPVAGALEFPAAIRWVQFGDGGNELHVASGAWLHVVDRSDAGLVVRSSRLLPVALRDAASLSRVGETRFRGVTAVGGGQLVLAEIETGQRAAADADVEPTLLGRDWEQILAVSL